MRTVRTLALAAGLVLTFAHSWPARAQMAVIDVGALGQLTQQLAQAKAQVQLLQQQVTGLRANVTAPLADISRQATQLLKEAQGIGYASTDLGREFASLNPSNLHDLNSLNAALSSWQQQSRRTLQESMQVQNQVASSQQKTASAVSGAVAASQSAQGQTAAVQATNQLLAVLSTQLGQLQTLVLAQARAAETAAAQQQAASASAEADRERRYAKPGYTPHFTRDRL